MALNQNQFAMSTTVGTKLWGYNVMTVQFYSATGTDTLNPGEAVVFVGTANTGVPQVARGTGLTSQYSGIALVNMLKPAFAVGDYLEIALSDCLVYMTADASITAGQFLQYVVADQAVAPQVSTNTAIGQAVENASTSGLVRVLTRFSGVGGATGPQGATGSQGAQGGVQGAQGPQGVHG